MKFSYLGNTAEYLCTEKGKKARLHLEDALPVYIQENSSKIKPIHLKLELDHLYELKLKIADKYYRLCYQKCDEQIRLLYLSTTLCKRFFEQELAKFLSRDSIK